MTGARVVEKIRLELRSVASAKKARDLQWFFKTGPGEYGEGDKFIGVTVPLIRKVVRKHREAGTPVAKRLLRSRIHEERMSALLFLVQRFPKAEQKEQASIYSLYLKNTRYINNWDLVDCSAPTIVGGYLLERERTILKKLARSASLWERRIAMIATLYFIKRGDFGDALKIARLLLDDEHDLIHKAAGWMLREVGERDPSAEEQFLNRHHTIMPRTMLRYAIEKFPEAKRRRYLTHKG